MRFQVEVNGVKRVGLTIEDVYKLRARPDLLILGENTKIKYSEFKEIPAISGEIARLEEATKTGTTDSCSILSL